jgi:hypothetical protein
MMTAEEVADLIDRIRGRRGGPRLSDYRFDPVPYAEAIIERAEAEGSLAGLSSEDRERLRAELIRLGQADVEWIEGLTRLDYE